MRFTHHSHQKNDPPLFTFGMLGQVDQCGHKNGSLLDDPGLDSSSLPKHVDECYNKDGSSFVCPDPPPKHVDQCSQENISVLHGPCLVGSSLSKHPGECNQKNGSALHDPCLVDSSMFKHPGECNQKNGSSLVCPHPVDEVLALIQTYQMEFDMENSMGRLPGCFVREFGKIVSDYVILRDPFHNEFEVHVLKKVGEVFFADGWHVLKSVYPCYNPPIRHLLFRDGSNCKFGSSVVEACSPASTRPKSFVHSYAKELSPYDLHSGSLFLPWNGFGECNFSHLFSDLILVDSAGAQYTCALKIVLDSSGDLAYNLSGGWTDFCTTHSVVEGDRVEFSVAPYIASNVMYAYVYPRITVEDYLKSSNGED
ncbi:hypothetical protein P8452_76179 [Trifolium repens]|nr:hypothetical protein P8452_76179 [Trifolium repens]